MSAQNPDDQARTNPFVYVPRGWQTNASIMPAPPPAMRFTAAPGGALPSFPCTLVAMVVVCLSVVFLFRQWSLWLALRPSLRPRQQWPCPQKK
jgi:hypothetical protein